MTVFGIPMAHDDDPERAVRAAFRCRERLAELNAGSQLPLELRVGVTTGEAVADTTRREQFLVTGAPVNLAARLQTAAAPGEILVGALTRRLTRGAVVYGDVRSIAAKGFGSAEAWPAEKLTSALPAERDGITSGRSPLVGRERELQALVDEFDAVEREGTASLVTISGPPGIGKTRLVAEFIELVGGDRAFFGRCLPYGQGITLHPIRQILRAHLGVDADDDQARVIAKLDHRLRELTPDPREQEALGARLRSVLGLARSDELLATVAATEVADQLRWAVRRYFEADAGAGPRVLVFEDLHRAEDALLDLIEHLSATRHAPLLIVCIARPEFHEMRTGWGGRAPRGRSWQLGPLSDEESRSLIENLDAAGDLDAPSRADVIARAEGNPLYVEELLRVFVDPDPAPQGATQRASDVPATLVGVITARIDRVTPEVKTLLNHASLVGRLFSTAALEAIAGEPVRAASLDDAIRRDLLVDTLEAAPGGGKAFRFKHGLIRDVVYGTVPKGERVRMHDNYARWLERTYGDRRGEVAEIVAHHAEQAFVLAHELGRAESEALGLRALELLNSVALSARLRQDNAALGLYDRATAVAERLRAETPLRVEVIASRAVARYWRYGERETFERARAMYRDGPPTATSVRLLLAIGFGGMADGRPDEYIPVIDEAVATARAIGDPNLVAETLGVRANASYQSGDAQDYLERVDQAIVYARRSGATRELTRLLVLRYVMAVRRGEFTLAMAIEAEIEAKPPPPTSGAELGWLARRTELRHAIGDEEGAVAIADRALEYAREQGGRMVLGIQLWHLGDALMALDRCARARDVLVEATTIFVQLGQRGQIPEVAARCARARVRLADYEGARRDLESAEAVLLASDAESVSIVALAGAELADAFGDEALADTRFRASIAALEGSFFRVHLARARTAYATFLLSLGRRAEAREQLVAARAVYTDQLAARRRAEIDALLERCGVPV